MGGALEEEVENPHHRRGWVGSRVGGKTRLVSVCVFLVVGRASKCEYMEVAVWPCRKCRS